MGPTTGYRSSASAARHPGPGIRRDERISYSPAAAFNASKSSGGSASTVR